FQAIVENPGKKAGHIARILNLHRSEVTRALPALEKLERVIYEDEQGGLWVDVQKPKKDE
ncbi:MAG: hypothetical protein MUC85_12170, partial [Anaerolineales bacterium]|nr:hypothetical protein [Anaerolineales bacterium]